MAASLHVLSTESVAPRERAPAWGQWLSQQFGRLQSDFYGDAVFDGRLASARAGDVILARMEAGRHRVRRSGPFAGDAAYLKIIAPWRGIATVQQRGREACAHAGGWVVYDTSGEFEIGNPQPMDHLMVMVPRDGLLHGGRRFDGVMARALGGSGISRVALEVMRRSFLELPNMSLAVAEGAGELIKSLVRLSLMEAAGEHTPLTQREALRDRIRAYIRHNLHDPALGVDAVAKALRCSRRHLYNAFDGEGESIAAYIQKQRLEACMRDMSRGDARGRSITEIALSWGFANPSHFSRVFREHTGRSPSEFRAGRLGG
jgi:AraC-like DNA-binding protein